MSTQRRVFALSAVAILTGMAIAAACSFPEPRVVDGDGGATPDVTTDTGNDDDAATDGDAPIDDGGAPPVTDANGAKPDVEVDGCVCDCDGDKYHSATQLADACAPGIEPGDCDDLDPRANPDSGWVSDQPTKDTQGNWNCDSTGSVTAEYRGNVNCGAIDLSLPPCAKRMGFVGNPGCGEEGDFVQCETQGLSCVAGPPVKKKRACQ